MRYPAASYFAYFPTKSGYPVHPELKGDPFRETVDLCKKNGMKVVAYVPLNHPFMDATSKDPRYADWSKKFADGTPMTTEHYGFAKYFEGCLNSPVREVIRALVREVLTQISGGRDVLRRSLPGDEQRQGILPLQVLRGGLPEAVRQAGAHQSRTTSSTPNGWPTRWSSPSCARFAR